MSSLNLNAKVWPTLVTLCQLVTPHAALAYCYKTHSFCLKIGSPQIAVSLYAFVWGCCMNIVSLVFLLVFLHLYEAFVQMFFCKMLFYQFSSYPRIDQEVHIKYISWYSGNQVYIHISIKKSSRYERLHPKRSTSYPKMWKCENLFQS